MSYNEPFHWEQEDEAMEKYTQFSRSPNYGYQDEYSQTNVDMSYPAALSPPQEYMPHAPHYRPQAERTYTPSHTQRRTQDYDSSHELSALHEIEPHTTLGHFLTTPNPRIRGPVENPNLRRRNAKSPEFSFIWWDIRNVRTWQDFNLATMMSIPGLRRLLEVPVPNSYLPEPTVSPRDVQLGDKPAFARLANLYFCSKTSTALATALGDNVLSMILGEPSLQQSDFVGLYEASTPRRIRQNRVPGFMKSCREWNSLMQAGADGRRREYLQVLSQLHRYMRDHGSRYGYILTEQELVCVRAASDEEGRPIFGCLDVSVPINWNQQGQGRFTISLALWYLHMLAKSDPLPGQYGWELAVPKDPRYMSRQHTLPKDPWIPTPSQDDLETATSIRGWGEADDPFSYSETLL